MLAHLDTRHKFAQSLSEVASEPRPAYAALAALILGGGLSSQQLAQLHVADIRERGALIRLERGEIALRHPVARIAVDAQREIQLLCGKHRRALLFPSAGHERYATETLERSLRRIGDRIKINLHTPATRRRESDLEWTYRCRVGVATLRSPRPTSPTFTRLTRAA